MNPNRLLEITLTAVFAVASALPPPLLAGGSRGLVCTVNPSACLKSMVLAKSFPGPSVAVPTVGTAVLTVSNTLFMVCPTINNCSVACNAPAVPVSATLTVTLSPPAAPVCASNSPAYSASISTANNTMTVPACTPVGTFNAYSVSVTIPASACAGIYTAVGTATVVFSDGTVLTQTGDTAVCLVPEVPGQPGVPRLSVELLTPSFPRAAPGDQHVATYRIINNDLANSVTVTPSATSKQAAVRPQGGNEYQGIFAISNPFGDDFPIAFSPAGGCLPLPPPPYTQNVISNPPIVIPPGQSHVITVGIRSYGQCASGSCSESTLRVQGVFSDNTPAFAAAGLGYFVDTSQPSPICAFQVNDCNHNGIPDTLDIEAQRSQDQNFNAVPDECEPLVNIPVFSSVTPHTSYPGAPLQVQFALNEVLVLTNAWANGSALTRTQFFGSPMWVGTIPADTRPGPQTVYFLGRDSQGRLSSYLGGYSVQPLPAAPQILTPVFNLFGQQFRFTVPTVSNTLYRVEAKPTLDGSTPWTPGEAFSGNGSNLNMSVPLTPAPAQYYRLVAGNLPTVTNGCGDLTRIYTNATAGPVNVTVQATDNCPSLDSEVYVLDADNNRGAGNIIPDAGTSTATFTVPAGGRLYFSCRGTGDGSCRYTITGP